MPKILKEGHNILPQQKEHGMSGTGTSTLPSLSIPAGLSFVHPIGLPATTSNTVVLLDDGTAHANTTGWITPRCSTREHHSNLRTVSFTPWTGIRAWLAATNDNQVGSRLSHDGLRSVAYVVMWHEIGHAILTSHTRGELWSDHVEEIWCDAFGCAAALAIGHSPEGILATDELHREPSLPTDADEFDPDVFRSSYIHTTLGVGQAVLARWNRQPWTTDLQDLLMVASEECATIAPSDPVADRTRFDALRYAAETRGRRCLKIVNPHFAKTDLALVVERNVSVAELAAEMLTHLAAGRAILAPRRDLPGGETAAAALRLAQQK